MDPNETLKKLRKIVAGIINEADGLHREKEIEFAEAFEDLDDWICSGGFLPNDWENVHLVQLEVEMKDYFRYIKETNDDLKKIYNNER